MGFRLKVGWNEFWTKTQKSSWESIFELWRRRDSWRNSLRPSLILKSRNCWHIRKILHPKLLAQNAFFFCLIVIFLFHHFKVVCSWYISASKWAQTESLFYIDLSIKSWNWLLKFLAKEKESSGKGRRSWQRKGQRTIQSSCPLC